MQLIILGKTADDKGTQLERLTGTILKKLGYSNVVFSEINAGGDERDVTADFLQPGIDTPIVQKVLVECKAYNKPITLPDWLKFLGKVFSAELGKVNVQGCFIALSGANGNVTGHYNNVKASRSDIRLIAGDSLLISLKSPYKLCSSDDISTFVAAQTQKKIVGTSLCYYQDTVYWIISFKENSYTLLSHDGKNLSTKEAALLHDLVIKETDLVCYIDLQAENEAFERAYEMSKYVMTIFMDKGKALKKSEILKMCQVNFGGMIADISTADIEIATHNLVKNKIAIKKGQSFILQALSSPTPLVDDILLLYRFTLVKDIKLIALKSDFYQENINEELLKGIVEFHGNIVIPSERHSEIIQLLKWSPSALNYAINIDPFIQQHRSKYEALTPELEEHDTAHFIRTIYQNFIRDFQNQGFVEYINKFCGLTEIETTFNVKIKSNSTLLYQNRSDERLGIFDMDFNGVPKPIIISILKNQPETWDWGDTVQDTIPPKNVKKDSNTT